MAPKCKRKLGNTEVHSCNACLFTRYLTSSKHACPLVAESVQTIYSQIMYLKSVVLHIFKLE